MWKSMKLFSLTNFLNSDQYFKINRFAILQEQPVWNIIQFKNGPSHMCKKINIFSNIGQDLFGENYKSYWRT